jgi:YggT family protein
MGTLPGPVKRGPRAVSALRGARAALVELSCCACSEGAPRVPSARDPRRHGIMYNPFLWLFDTLIGIYIWLLIAQAVLSWLLAFGVINRYNRGVAVVGDFLYRVTEPVLRPIRSILPNFGGVDISPVILILLLVFLRRLVDYYLFAYL